MYATDLLANLPFIVEEVGKKNEGGKTMISASVFGNGTSVTSLVGQVELLILLLVVTLIVVLLVAEAFQKEIFGVRIDSLPGEPFHVKYFGTLADIKSCTGIIEVTSLWARESVCAVKKIELATDLCTIWPARG